MPPYAYVGMARKKNGGYNVSISVQTLIFHLVNSMHLKTVRYPRWCCPNSTMAPRLLENVVKVTNLVKILLPKYLSPVNLYSLFENLQSLVSFSKCWPCNSYT